MQASEQEVDRRGSDFSDRHLAMATWAWGELGHAPGPRGMAALLREVQGRAPGLGAQELCTLLKVGSGLLRAGRWWCMTVQRGSVCRAWVAVAGGADWV